MQVTSPEAPTQYPPVCPCPLTVTGTELPATLAAVELGVHRAVAGQADWLACPARAGHQGGLVENHLQGFYCHGHMMWSLLSLVHMSWSVVTRSYEGVFTCPAARGLAATARPLEIFSSETRAAIARGGQKMG